MKGGYNGMTTKEKTQEGAELSQSNWLWFLALLPLLVTAVFRDLPGGSVTQLVGYAAGTAAFGVLARQAKERGDKGALFFARMFIVCYIVPILSVLGWLVYDLFVA